jgi:hypothetical protein
MGTREEQAFVRRGEDAIDAGSDHLLEGVLGQVGVTGVVEGVGEGPGKPEALVELVDAEQPGIAGELALGRLETSGVTKRSRCIGARRAVYSLVVSAEREQTGQLTRLDVNVADRFQTSSQGLGEYHRPRGLNLWGRCR